ncbi:hypothetical protein GCM10011504_51910 [Siccirubricoccus deserti]|nr:hypothetical protein GCM10011504_51910 [Siccirubricoccus deserti]
MTGCGTMECKFTRQIPLSGPAAFARLPGLSAAPDMLSRNAMPPRFADPLALASGAAARLALAAGVLGLLWIAVAWAMAA